MNGIRRSTSDRRHDQRWGDHLKDVLTEIDQGRCPALVKQVISSNANASGNRFATDRKIPLHVANRADHTSDEAYSEALFSVIREAEVRYVIPVSYTHLTLPTISDV